ncbi:MAG: SH3 domain-containing protein [Ruminococcus sp.]|nr:SH3 domain-containing protein [Ruminococcus sp.]
MDNKNKRNIPTDNDDLISNGDFWKDEPSAYFGNRRNPYTRKYESPDRNNFYSRQEDFQQNRRQSPYYTQPNYSNIPQNPQQPYNREYAEQPKKKTSVGMIVMLIAVVIFFAVIIMAMSTIMKAMVDKGNNKPVNADGDNLIIAENTTETTPQTTSETTTETVTEEVTEAVTTEKTVKFADVQTATNAPVTEIVTVTVIVEVEKTTEKQKQTQEQTTTQTQKQTQEQKQTTAQTQKQSQEQKQTTAQTQKQSQEQKQTTAQTQKQTQKQTETQKQNQQNQQIKPLYEYTVNNYSLPIYNKPEYDGTVIGRIEDRGTYAIVEESEHWGKLADGGWIDFDTAETIGYMGEKVTAYVATKSDPLSMRYTPDKKSKLITSIPKGTSLTVYETADNKWYYTTYNGKSGFVSADYLSFSKPAENDLTVYDTPNYACVATKNDALNIRDTPSSNGKIIGSIPKGKYIDVYTTSNSKWYYTTYKGVSGYVSADYVTLILSGDFYGYDSDYNGYYHYPDDNSQNSANGGTYDNTWAVIATQKDPLNLRSYASTGADVVTTIPKGTSVYVEVYGSDWCYISWNGYTGYASTQFLAF